MVYPLTYRRPPHVDAASRSLNGDEKAQSIGESVSSSGTGVTHGIPDALAFDRIIAGGTCPPCTTRDFMNYLIYIEHAAENLQFFLWYRDYSKRFSELPDGERVLAPEWTTAQAEAEALASQTNAAGLKKISPETVAVFTGTDFAPGGKPSFVEFAGNPFNTPPRTPPVDKDGFAPSEYGWSDDGSTLRSSNKSFAKKAAGAYEGADLKWQPFTVQPFREEVSRIIATYVADGAPRQLNLSSKERTALLHALALTTHPSAFRGVVNTVEWSLRHQAHPNFIRWTICNGNRPRVIFARGLGVGGIVAGIITAILIILSNAGRGWRVLSAIGLVIGIATLIAAWKGMCVVLHGMHHRHLRPWELFAEDDDASSNYEMKKGSFDSLGTCNSYEDEPWIAKYEKRNIIRKVFDREVWIQEPALRQIQDTIFLQAVGGAIVISAVAVGVFVAIPKGNFY
ncbi:MAG: hypothetical protein M1830_008221 [Pleopsidium flavum]|nr:MAG: hypothetical protein M1830_008221 [Pleopsidium flavum]